MKKSIYYLIVVYLFSHLNFFAQKTMYWIGGSGKWNDPTHWSYTSGGTPSHSIPDKHTTVVIDEYSCSSPALIELIGNYEVAGLKINSFQHIYIQMDNNSQLSVNGDFIISFNTHIAHKSPIILNNPGNSPSLINTGGGKINGDIVLQGNVFSIEYLSAKKMILNCHTIEMNRGYIDVATISMGPQLKYIRSNASVIKSLTINVYPDVKWEAHQTHIVTNSNIKKEIFTSGSEYKTYNTNQITACTASLTGLSASCAGICDGKLILTVSGCSAATPYTLDWSNSSCTPSPTLSSILGNGTYTISGVCPCANVYVVWIYDANNNLITISNNASVQGPSLIGFNITNITPPSCNGFCNGSVSAIVSGGTPTSPGNTYTVVVDATTTYTNVPQGSSYTYTALCAGTHTFVVTDANGCTRTFTVNLTQPAPLLANGSFTNVSCFNACNGAMQVSPTGGTPGYTVNWSTGSSVAIGAGGSASINGLCNGVYTATVTDTKSCTAIYTATITQPTSITIVPTQTNVSCYGLCDATASVNVTGGTPPYTYSWSCSASTTNSATSLCAGSCTVTVTDNNTCVKTQSFNIIQPGSITIVASPTPALCNGSCNGKVSFTVNGGTPVFQYTISPVGITGTTNANATILNLCAGNYTISIKDANNCMQTQTFVINQPAALTGTVNVTNATCNGLCNGSATLIPGGGTPGYTFTWTPGNQTVNPISSICSGVYNVIIKDANNCTVSISYTINQPPPIAPNITSSSITCNGSCNGSINSSPTGGTPPFTYTLTGPATTIITNPPYTNLCAGTYTLFIKDANNCTSTSTINLQQPNALIIIAASTSVSCYGGCDGSVSGSASGGTPPYVYVWNVPPSGTSFTTPVLTNQCAGTYTLTVIDGNNCTNTRTVNIIAPSDMTISATTNSTTCSYNCNGSITTTVTGGNPAYSYNWSTGATSNSITGLCAGTYTLTVTDSKNCTKVQTFTITSPPPISITTSVQNVLCFGACNGSATATASGGTPGYVYQWSTIPVTNSSTVTNLCPGNYVVTVTDSKGCVASQNISITQPAQLQANITGVQASCSSTCIGAATVTPTGGTPAYSYTWLPSGGNASVASGLCIGNYTVIVKDINGCSATTTVAINQSIFLILTTSGNTLTCNGLCNGAANVNVSGGLPPYTYTWTSNSGTISNSPNVSGLCAGGYTITVTDNQGCQNTDSVRFNNPPPITITSSNVINVTCNGLCNGQINVTATGGTGSLNYSWTPSGITGNGTGTVTNLCAGNYTVDIKDANNCVKTATFTVNQPPATTITLSNTDPTNCTSVNGIISGTISGGNPNYNYTINPGPSGNTSSSFTATGLSAGAYTIIIQDANGCNTNSVVALNGPGGPTITSITTQSVSCYGGSNGSATVVATSTNPPLSYTWTPSVSGTNVASGLSAGVYVISVGDAGSCVTNTVINIAQPSQFSLNPTISQPLCNSNCSGAISVSPSGGTSPYSYTWSPLGSNSQNVNNLCPGTYTLNIQDANNCTYIQTFTINPPSTLNVTFSKQDVLCNGACNGSVTANVNGGTPPYTYTWTPVGSFSGSSLPSIVGLCPNTYTLNVQDNGSCNITLTVSITEPSVLSSTLVNTPSVNCNGSCNGSATVTAGGGTPPYSYGWTGSAATTSVVNSLCAGTYSSTVTDANGCQSIKTFTITQPTPINVTLTPVNPPCYGICTGSISSNVTGGNGGYTYTWVPSGGNSSTAVNLCAGNYTLLVKDSKNCTSQQVTSITNPPKILANITYTNPTSCSICNGVANSNPLNATSPVNFTWTTTPPQTVPTATGLCGGTYTVYIQDAKGCKDSGQVTLSAPVILTVNPSMSPSDCSICNGSITIGIGGGTPPYTFNWNPAVSTTSVATNLCSGVYTVTVTDANLCQQTFQLPLSNSNGPSGINITYTNVSCNGYCDGSAVASPPITGGTAPYTYTWVSPPVSSATITNLCAGTYTVQVTDANNCKYFQSVTITEPLPLNANANIANPQCNGICNGSISISPSGGTAPYSYTWSTGATGSSITSLCLGTYSVNIVDNNGCQYPLTYTLVGGISITASTFAVNNNCYYDCNGSASVVGIAGGLPPYTFNWSDPLGQSNATATGLCNGTYTCIVTDNNGCYESFSVSISSPSSVTAVYSSTNPSCGNCDGSINVNLSGGTPGYTVQWSNGSMGTNVTNICAGLYMITVTDANNCQQNLFIPISNNSSLISSITVTNPACFGNCVGSATVTATGGTPPYTYLWINSGNTSNIENGLCAGTYYVQVKDSNNCISTNPVNIVATSNIQITPSINQPTCGSTNGTIAVNVSGGTSPYSYTWSPGSSTSATLTNVGSGTYTVQVQDASGCSTSSVFVVSNQNGPIANLNIINTSCSSSCDGAASITVTAGASPYTIQWFDGTTVTGNFSNISGLCSGLITATVTDNSGCQTILSGAISSPTAILNSMPIAQYPNCYGDTNGAIQVVTSGGTLPYTYTFLPSGSNANPLTNIGTGNYTINVSDVKGCSASFTLNINQPQPITVTANVIDASCSALMDGSITTTVTGGNPTYTYSWSGPNSYTNSTNNATNIGIGTYSLHIIDTKGCTKDTSFVINSTLTLLASANSGTAQCGSYTYTLDGSSSINATTYQWTQLPLSNTLATTPSVIVNASVGTNSFVLTVTNGTCIDTQMVILVGLPLPNVDAGPFSSIPVESSTVIGGGPTAPTATSYVWMPPNDLSNPNSSNPIASPTITTTYTLIVTDNNGCMNWDTVTVYVYPEIDIPNGFSPNGDGKNDYWIIDNIEQFPDCEVEVYNRWGEQLFYSKGYKKPWDGKYKGMDVPVGTYYYIIRLHSPLYPKDYTGPLTVFR